MSKIDHILGRGLPSRPRCILLACVVGMDLLSLWRYLGTGTIMVDRSGLQGVGGTLAVLAYLSILLFSGIALYRVVIRRPGWDMSGGQVRRLALELAVVAFPMLPMLSNDVFSVLAYGDLALRGINPYVDGCRLMHSSFYDWVGVDWKSAPCVYGPVNLITALAAVALGKWGGVWGCFWVWKLFNLVAAIGMVEGIWRFLRTGPEGTRNLAALVLLSPIFWLQGAGQAHNDLVAAALLAFALWPLCRERWLSGILFLSLAFLAKATAIVALPAAGLILWDRYRKAPLRLAGALATAGSLIIITAAVAYAPFWNGLATLRVPAAFLADKSASKSPVQVGYDLLTYIRQSWIWLTQGGNGGSSLFSKVVLEDVRAGFMGMSLAFFQSFAILLLLPWLRKVLDSGDPTSRLRLCALAGFSVVCFFSPVFHAWYFLSLLPLLAFLPGRSWARWGSVVLVFANTANLARLLEHDHPLAKIAEPVFVVGTVALFFWMIPGRFWRVEEVGTSPVRETGEMPLI